MEIKKKGNRFGAAREFQTWVKSSILFDRLIDRRQAFLDLKRRCPANRRGFASIRPNERLNFIISSKLIKLTIPLRETSFR